jgi:hypothetical protein
MNVGLAAVVLATASPTPIVASNGGGDGASGSDTGDSTPWAHRVCGGPHLTGSRVKVQVLAGALGDGGAATGPLEKFNHELLVRAGLLGHSARRGGAGLLACHDAGGRLRIVSLMPASHEWETVLPSVSPTAEWRGHWYARDLVSALWNVTEGEAGVDPQ